MSRVLFGTDGVRGLAGDYPLDQTGLQAIGKAVGTHFAQPGQQVVIGCDTRESSAGMVREASAGLQAAGVDVVTVGVIPTPGLAYITREHDEFVAGVMITASHNPYQYNGIKVFGANGGKLTDQTEATLNTLIESGVDERGNGTASAVPGLVQDYEDFLVASAGGLQLAGLPIVIDSANGAASGLAARVFGRLGASVIPLFDTPDGVNINATCGATDPAALATQVKTNRAALGIALDGDADRLVMVDGQGRDAKGDHIMYILAISMAASGVVATIMSNMGFEHALQARGIALERTAVGDRYVLEGLERTGYMLGGEQSGHIILPGILQTGDGLLAAIQTVKAIMGSGKNLAQWRDEVTLLPQALVNIALPDKSRLDQPAVKEFLRIQAEQFAGQGRLLIRPSGTEPLARVMVEAPDASTHATRIADQLKELVA